MKGEITEHQIRRDEMEKEIEEQAERIGALTEQLRFLEDDLLNAKQKAFSQAQEIDRLN